MTISMCKISISHIGLTSFDIFTFNVTIYWCIVLGSTCWTLYVSIRSQFSDTAQTECMPTTQDLRYTVRQIILQHTDRTPHHMKEANAGSHISCKNTSNQL